MKNYKQRLYQILNMTEDADKTTRFINIIIFSIIILNVAAVILGTVTSFHNQYKYYLDIFEIFSVTFFSAEYLLRLWVCKFSYPDRNSMDSVIRYIFSPMAMIDLAAVLPFYIPFFFTLDLRFIRALRLIRIIRLFKIGRYSNSLNLLINVLRSKKPELMITLFILSILLIVSSSFMYFIENEVQPDSFSSIPAAMWWGVSTLTTVGYGDIYPVTYTGKVLGAIISIIGIGLFALPAGILASGLIEELHNKQRTSKDIIKKYPHCGKELEL